MKKLIYLFSMFAFLSCATSKGLVDYPAKNVDDYNAGEGWTLEWSDEFETFDENVWTRQILMMPFNNELQKYTGEPETTYAKDGCLVLKAEKINNAFKAGSFTSARVISNPGGNKGDSPAEGKTFLYGKIAARIQIPYGKGIWPAFWMLGDNVTETGGRKIWPVCGEIDILEAGSQHYDNWGQSTITGALHHDYSPDNSKKRNRILLAGKKTLPDNELLASQFRVYEIEWNEEEIIWRLDGKQFGRVSISEETRDEFHKPFYVIFNIAVGGNFTFEPDKDTYFPQYMYVDWIRHYTK